MAYINENTHPIYQLIFDHDRDCPIQVGLVNYIKSVVGTDYELDEYYEEITDLQAKLDETNEELEQLKYYIDDIFNCIEDYERGHYDSANDLIIDFKDALGK